MDVDGFSFNNNYDMCKYLVTSWNPNLKNEDIKIYADKLEKMLPDENIMDFINDPQTMYNLFD